MSRIIRMGGWAGADVGDADLGTTAITLYVYVTVPDHETTIRVCRREIRIVQSDLSSKFKYKCGPENYA
jgi:hypothetical protein